MPFCWHPQGVYCAPKKLLGSFPSVLSTTLSPSLRSCSRLLFPRGTRVTCKEKSPPSRHIAAKTPDPKISGPAPTPVQKPALSSDRQHAWKTGSRCSLVSHSYTPLLLLDTQTDSIRNASRGPESTEAVNQRPPHGHTAHCSRAACRTASPQRASRGTEMSRTQRI